MYLIYQNVYVIVGDAEISKWLRVLVQFSGVLIWISNTHTGIYYYCNSSCKGCSALFSPLCTPGMPMVHRETFKKNTQT